jgi:hypothetical protein
MATRATLLVLCLLAAAQPLQAQMDMSEHGGAPPAHLGHVRFPTSCNAAASAAVERGVALLHSFWYEEAAKVFREAAAADSGCAMAYWGGATSLLHPLWQAPTAQDLKDGAALVERARAAHPPTPRERGYVEAIGAFYDDSGPRFVDRLRAWEKGFARLHQAQPADTEAAIFYALTLIAVAYASPTDTTFALQKQAGDILDPLFQVLPNHPGLAHYLIHAYDFPPLAARAVGAANRYADIAPSVPHARHMPSHIYTRLGMWDASIASNTSSMAASLRYERQQHLTAVWDQRLHAMDYLEYAYLQQGRTGAARRLVAQAARMHSFVPANSVAGAYALAAIPARYALERGQWREAAALPVRPDLAEPSALAITQFARTVGAARSGDTVGARAALAVLDTIDDDLAANHVPIWTGTVHAQRLAASAWLALAVGDTAGAVSLGRQAADLEDATEKHPVTPGAILPARELEGDLLLQLGRPADALAAYRTSLPGSRAPPGPQPAWRRQSRRGRRRPERRRRFPRAASGADAPGRRDTTERRGRLLAYPAASGAAPPAGPSRPGPGSCYSFRGR